jgi:hypothetical protein
VDRREDEKGGKFCSESDEDGITKVRVMKLGIVKTVNVRNIMGIVKTGKL